MRSEVRSVAELTARDTEQMFALYRTYFDAVSEPAFRADLLEKDYVIFLFGEQDQIRGFSTFKLIPFSLGRALYSGDTIIHHEFWGEQTLPLAFARQAGRIAAAHPGDRLFWFLITKGYRTYRYLPLFFHEYFPRHDRSTPPEIRGVLDELAFGKFGRDYQPASGIVHFAESRGHLRDRWADVRPAMLRKPEVHFFLQRNPGYRQGDELVCIAELKPSNIRPFARRAFEDAAKDTTPSPWPRLLRLLAGSRERVIEAARNTAREQQAQITSILAANSDSEFGRAHNFAGIRTIDEYRRAVPLQDYSTLSPYIDRAASGVQRQLTTASPVVFEQTGGSTAGSKLIPYTEAGLHAIQRAVHAWLDDLLQQRPGIQRGRCYWAISPASRPRETTAAGIPIGLSSDAAYFGAALEGTINELLAVPPSVARGTSVKEWREATLAALRAAPDLSFVSVWSPTFWLELVRALDEDPKILWPRLDTISCWTAGASAPFARQLAEIFPTVHIQGKGLLATEGVVTIPIVGHPYPLLAVESGYYEFLDAKQQSHGATDLKESCEYEVVMTTHSGLYRYRIGDRVVMRGWASTAPMLEFLGRAGAVSDLCGEKLDDAFVSPRLSFLRGFRLLVPLAMPRPGYLLILDAGEYDEDAASTAARRLDEGLSDNPQYAYARQLGQLDPVAPLRISQAMERYYDHLQERGQHLGDIKAPGFVANGEWIAVWREHLPLSLRSGR